MQLGNEALFMVLVLATPCATFAQSTTGTVTGTVKDSQGLGVPGAAVELINEDTGVTRSTVSLANGTFNVRGDSSRGATSVRVTLEGFSVTEKHGLQLRSNETLDVGSITLGIGHFSQVTTVTADKAVVQTASSEISSAIEAEPDGIARCPRT